MSKKSQGEEPSPWERTLGHLREAFHPHATVSKGVPELNKAIRVATQFGLDISAAIHKVRREYGKSDD